jgi:hypothetical protein
MHHEGIGCELLLGEPTGSGDSPLMSLVNTVMNYRLL